jgi:hypothetical protein
VVRARPDNEEQFDGLSSHTERGVFTRCQRSRFGRGLSSRRPGTGSGRAVWQSAGEVGSGIVIEQSVTHLTHAEQTSIRAGNHGLVATLRTEDLATVTAVMFVSFVAQRSFALDAVGYVVVVLPTNFRVRLSYLFQLYLQRLG